MRGGFALPQPAKLARAATAPLRRSAAGWAHAPVPGADQSAAVPQMSDVAPMGRPPQMMPGRGPRVMPGRGPQMMRGPRASKGPQKGARSQPPPRARELAGPTPPTLRPFSRRVERFVEGVFGSSPRSNHSPFRSHPAESSPRSAHCRASARLARAARGRLVGSRRRLIEQFESGLLQAAEHLRTAAQGDDELLAAVGVGPGQLQGSEGSARRRIGANGVSGGRRVGHHGGEPVGSGQVRSCGTGARFRGERSPRWRALATLALRVDDAQRTLRPRSELDYAS